MWIRNFKHYFDKFCHLNAQTTANGVRIAIKHGVFCYTFVTAAVLSVAVTKGNLSYAQRSGQ
jgi:hypothetical protein